jgi:predicted CxxxxCH...CXXCH cytochrome family protein
MSHRNTTVEVPLDGTLATSGTATAGGTTWNGTTCAATYCHNGSLVNGALGYSGPGAAVTPNWTDNTYLDGTKANDCAQCHANPPGNGHNASNDCSLCHLNTVAADDGFTVAALHVNGSVESSADDCTVCHAADIDGALNGAHGAHSDTATFLAGKTISGGAYGGAGWYGTTYVNGQPVFGCGQCHPAVEASHPMNGLNVDVDPAGETPGAGNVKTMNTTQNLPSNTSRVSVTCASVYCHSDAAGTFKTTNNWYNDPLPTDGTECASCHGNSPTTAAHGVHEVGIHYEELYDNDGLGLMAATGGVGSGAAHGDSDASSTITCYTCHSGTVTDTANAANSTCTGCHSDTNSIATGNELARILTTSSTHINGVKDVAFADLSTFKSKAQLRDNLADADDGTNLLSQIWNRITGYKGATDYDTPQAAFAAPSFAGGTCSTVACHNGNTATWTDSGVDCMYCHTSLPK